MKKILFAAGAFCMLVAVCSFTAIQNWTIGDKYSVVFSSSEVSGIFKKLSGTIAFDPANAAQSKFDIAIDVASINTGNALQNKHAKEAEWFDAAKFPQIKFTSTKVVKAGAGFTATGTLEIKGVKKEVSLPFTFKAAGNAGTFAGSFNINRSDFKVGKPGGEVAEAIKVEVTIPVVK